MPIRRQEASSSHERDCNLAQNAADLVGTYRTFGDYGPTYQVVSTVNGQKVHVIVVQTGEELDYPTEQALNDPESH